MSIFTERLIECRKAKVTQKEMAIYLGISERAYQHYEAGTRTPKIDIATKIADFLNISVDYLLGRTDKQEVNK